jgi:hypothetical protein
MEMLSNPSTWSHYTGLLYQASDTACFFIGIGFQKMIWRNWRNMSEEDRTSLKGVVGDVIINRTNLQPFARSKLEQVLAAICANSCSLEPVLVLLVPDASNPNVSIGLSATRTVLDLILSDDPQLYPEYKPALSSAVMDIVAPLTNLACNACTVAIGGNAVATGSTATALSSALDLLKVIVSKLQVGPHITCEVLDLLFRVASQGCSSSGAAERAALSAVEVLTEIMGKKYLPPRSSQSSSGSSSSSSSSSSSGARAANGSAATPVDPALMMMQVVLEQAAGLLAGLRGAGGGELQVSPLALSVLELVSVLSESHLEKCVLRSTLQGAASSSKSTPGSPAAVDGGMDQAVLRLLEELVAVTTSTMDPELLHKAAAVWLRVLAMGAVKEAVLGRAQLCLSITSHLLRSCLLQTSPHLRDCAEELAEDLTVEGQADPHLRAVLSHLSAEARGQVEGAEEAGYVGTELRGDAVDLLGELFACPEVAGWLAQTVPQLVSEASGRLLGQGGKQSRDGPDAPALDLVFLLRLLTIVHGREPAQLVAQLTGLAVQLALSGTAARGQEVVAVVVTCCQQAGQLLQSGRVAPVTAAGVTADALSTMERLFCDPSPGLLVGVCGACGCPPSSPGHHPANVPPSVVTALSALLLQCVAVYADLLEMDQAQCESVRRAALGSLQSVMGQQSQQLSVEVVALSVCAQDLLQPHGVAQSIVAQCVELVGTLEASQGQQSTIGMPCVDVSFRVCSPALQLADVVVRTDQLIRVAAALDALARNHSISRPQRRQCLVTYMAPLQQVSRGRLSRRCYLH